MCFKSFGLWALHWKITLTYQSANNPSGLFVALVRYWAQKIPFLSVSLATTGSRPLTAVWEKEQLHTVSTGWGSLHRAERCAWPPSPSQSWYREADRYSPLLQCRQQQSSVEPRPCSTLGQLTRWENHAGSHKDGHHQNCNPPTGDLQSLLVVLLVQLDSSMTKQTPNYP